MNAIELLKADHHRVRTMFREMEQSEKDAEKRQLLAFRIFEELLTHARIEEKLFYPAVEKALDNGSAEKLRTSRADHAGAERLIRELSALSPDDEAFAPRFVRLVRDMEHHMAEEEAEVLPLAARVLRGELEDLGCKMEAMRKDLGQPKSRRGELGVTRAEQADEDPDGLL